MSRQFWAVVVGSLALGCSNANADIITSFQVNGTFSSPPPEPLTGSFTVDETLLSVTAADLVVGGISQHFDIPISTLPEVAPPGVYKITINNSVGDSLFFDITNLSLTTGGLINGGAVWPPDPCAGVVVCVIYNYSALDNNVTGTYVPDGSALQSSVPEPLTLSVFCGGIVGAFAARRRKQKLS